MTTKMYINLWENTLFIGKQDLVKEKSSVISSEERVVGERPFNLISGSEPLYRPKYWFQQRQWEQVTNEKASLVPGSLFKSPGSTDSPSARQKGPSEQESVLGQGPCPEGQTGQRGERAGTEKSQD